MIQFDKATADKLSRLQELNAICDRMLVDRGETVKDDMDMDVECAELRAVQAELVEEFLPLVERLVRSGLLNVCIDVSREGHVWEYHTVFGDADEAFVNGNICISASEVSGGTPGRPGIASRVHLLAWARRRLAESGADEEQVAQYVEAHQAEIQTACQDALLAVIKEFRPDE